MLKCLKYCLNVEHSNTYSGVIGKIILWNVLGVCAKKSGCYVSVSNARIVYYRVEWDKKPPLRGISRYFWLCI